MTDQAPRDDDALYTQIGRDAKPHEVMLEQAARIAQLGYFVFNVRSSTVEVCSTRHAAIFGQSPPDFIKTVTGLGGEMTMIYPDDRNLIREAYGRLMQGETIEMEYRFYRPDHSIGYIREVVAPDRDEDGQIVRGLGSSLDVTETRLAEERRAQAGRLEALGELTAGVAHDFNNILAIVMGNAEMLQAGVPLAETGEFLEEIVTAARRGGALTQSLLNFAQKAAIRPVALDLGEEITRAATLFERTLLQKATMTVTRDDDPLPIFADKDKLQSVIINILINARDAVREGGQIEIRAERWTPPGTGNGDRAAHPTMIRLSIRDDGAGIAPQILARVTDPFFTTKPRASGSGLGLSMAAGFMRQLGGDLAIESQEGHGTEVHLDFPVSLHVDTGTRQDAASIPLHSNAVHILLLEDENALRALVQRNLKSWGFRVTAARNAAEALEAIEATQFDLALLDNFIPGDSTGVDIANRVKATSPDTATILLTGLANLQDRSDLDAVDLVLAKPIPASTLRARIAQTLAARKSPVDQRAAGGV
ncbi:ATP-binding response regulator [Antarctobacter jejuensis]|uniref:ATP-binding response regulator n=1 Tax=Antarctobacter jejuensis TaxID=1439938 RepID=UPI003FCFD0D2